MPCVVLAALPYPQIGKTGCGSELPKQSPLVLRDLDRVCETLFSQRRGLLAGFLEQQLPFDPQEFGEIPPLIPCLSALKHIVNGRESVRDLTYLAKANRQLPQR